MVGNVRSDDTQAAETDQLGVDLRYFLGVLCGLVRAISLVPVQSNLKEGCLCLYSLFLNRSEAFCPPKPKELLMASSISFFVVCGV